MRHLSGCLPLESQSTSFRQSCLRAERRSLLAGDRKTAGYQRRRMGSVDSGNRDEAGEGQGALEKLDGGGRQFRCAQAFAQASEVPVALGRACQITRRMGSKPAAGFELTGFPAGSRLIRLLRHFPFKFEKEAEDHLAVIFFDFHELYADYRPAFPLHHGINYRHSYILQNENRGADELPLVKLVEV